MSLHGIGHHGTSYLGADGASGSVPKLAGYLGAHVKSFNSVLCVFGTLGGA